MSKWDRLGGAAGRRVRQIVGPRPAMLVGSALVVVGLLAAFAYVVIDSQAQSRRDAEQQFEAEARITAQLTSTLFTTSAGETRSNAGKAFGGPSPNQDALDAFVKRSGWAYAMILASDGTLLAASQGTPATVRKRAEAAGSHIRSALEGRPSLSGVLPGTAGVPHVVEWALPFETSHGPRLQVAAFDVRGLVQFLRGYLEQPDGSGSRAAYLVDSQDNLIADSDRAGRVGDRLTGPLTAVGTGRYRSGGADRYAASAPLDGSEWRLILSQPTSELYPALAGSRSWLLFMALAGFGLAGIASIVFLRRSLVSAAQVAETNRRLAEVNATLEERVAERSAVAEERAEELARSNAELEQFASVASHDLQEPLRKIRMYCERLPRRLGDGLSEDAASDLDRVQGAAMRMQRLIDDLLAFARVTNRERSLEPVDLGEVTSEVIGDLEARVAELDARIELGDLPVVAADRAQIRQLMQNLLSNALKFHRDDAPPLVRIRGEVIPAQGPPFHGEAAAGARCLITVEDNGVGFDQKYAERIFSAFERLHSRSAYDGTGIGLSIARKIAWRHRGDITATSTPGQGATFRVTLPVSGGNGKSTHEGTPT